MTLTNMVRELVISQFKDQPEAGPPGRLIQQLYNVRRDPRLIGLCFAAHFIGFALRLVHLLITRPLLPASEATWHHVRVHWVKTGGKTPSKHALQVLSFSIFGLFWHTCSQPWTNANQQGHIPYANRLRLNRITLEWRILGHRGCMERGEPLDNTEVTLGKENASLSALFALQRCSKKAP